MRKILKQTQVRLFLICVFCLIGPIKGSAEDTAVITIKDHRFTPVELTVPAGKKIKLTIQNQDSTSEEFESYDLNREEIVDGNETISVFIGPLKPGKYEYFGEFNPDTAQGIIIAE